MKKPTITCFSDPGHGWIAVKRQLVREVGAMPFISSCSYQRGETVYLEEDCDAAKFLKLFFAEKGLDYISSAQLKDAFTVKDSWTNNRSAIRNYASFDKDTVTVSELKLGEYISINGNPYHIQSIEPKRLIVTNPMGARFKVAGINLDSIKRIQEAPNANDN